MVRFERFGASCKGHGLYQVWRSAAAAVGGVVLLAGCLFLASGAAKAQAADGPRSAWLADLTWMEVRAVLGAPETVIILPVGSVQAHGPHLPLGAGNRVLALLVERAVKADGHAISAPLIPFSPQMSEDDAGALKWPGTLHVSGGSLASVLGDEIASLKVHGGRYFVVVAQDPQTLEAIRETVQGLDALWAGQGVTISVAENLIEPNRDANILSRVGITNEPPLARGGALETAEVMACCRDLIRLAHIPRTAAAVESSGSEGQPYRATVELGTMSLAAKVGAIEGAITEVRSDSR